jgi:pimeloyl-ACP methyl ester carboxylesterase
MDSVLKNQGFFESFDGTKIYFESHGEGAPIVFCYGVGCLFNHWSQQVRYFSRTHKTFLFDYRGHHQTEIPEDKSLLTIESLAKDLIAYCEYMGIKKTPVVGHSFGVLVILKAYELRPDLFSQLIFINGLYRNPFDHLIQSDSLVAAINQIKKIYNRAPRLFSNLWEKGVTNPLMVPLSALTGGFNLSKTALKDIEIYAKGVASVDIRVFISFFEEMVAFDGEDFLSKIDLPTLIICGSKDSLTPMAEQERMNELIKGSELYIIPYGSHCTQLDFPEMVNLKIQNFLSGK